MTIRIGDRTIGPGHPPLIVAELSANHNQSLGRALELVEAAARAGADAVKLQTFTADTMTLEADRPEFRVADPGSPWAGRTLYQLYQEALTPWEWHPTLFQRCRELGLLAFSTPFDASAVAFLEQLGVPCHKIASQEIVDLPLIETAARTGKPLLLSTGMASASEIDEAVQAARRGGGRDLVLLKCTSTYPATAQNANLATLPHLRSVFGAEVGLSDHSLGIGVAVAAVALGASVVEKHFTLRRADGGVDATFSLEPEEMRALATECRRAWQAIGTVHLGPTADEQKSLQYRRSLYVVKDLGEGDVVTPENVRAIRPGLGLSPKYLQAVLGRRLRRPAPKGTPFSWDLLFD